jgi:hypothetical protein
MREYKITNSTIETHVFNSELRLKSLTGTERNNFFSLLFFLLYIDLLYKRRTVASARANKQVSQWAEKLKISHKIISRAAFSGKTLSHFRIVR